jgi:hypothetical protein
VLYWRVGGKMGVRVQVLSLGRWTAGAATHVDADFVGNISVSRSSSTSVLAFLGRVTEWRL